MDLFVSIDAPDIALKMNRLQINNDPTEMRILNNVTDLSRAMWHGWCLKNGGSILTEDGPKIQLMISVEYADEIAQLRVQYSHALDSRVAIGIGIEIGQSARALQAALKVGGDSILPYSEYCESVLEDHEVKKSEPVATRPTRPSRPTVTEPDGPQGEHSEADSLYQMLDDEGQDPAVPQDGGLEDLLHQHAGAQGAKDRQASLESSQDVQEIKQRVAESLKLIASQGDQMEAIRQSSPQTYQAMVGLAQAVIEMARQLRGQPIEKAEKMYCMACLDPLDKDGHCTVKSHWAALDTKKAELEKAGVGKLPMPHATAHQHQVLPVGSHKGAEGSTEAYKIKVAHGDPATASMAPTSTGWIQARAGQIRSQDPSGHPISSLNPKGR